MALDLTPSFSTVFNFRDLGGLVGGQGRTVRHGRLYRSDGLHRLAGDDLTGFADLGIRTVLDLRRPDIAMRRDIVGRKLAESKRIFRERMVEARLGAMKSRKISTTTHATILTQL